MDVVASVGAIVGLVFNFAKAIKICHDIKGRYEGVDETVASVEDELETLQGALKQLMALMMNDAAALSSRWDQEKHLPQTFAGAMKGFERTIQILMKDLKGLHSSVRDGGKEVGRGKKVAFIWNESALNGHCVQLRSQAAALHLLLGVLQTGSMSEFKTDLNELKAAIEKISLASNNAVDEPPMYTVHTDPTVHLLDFSDDLMDFEKLYPVDSPPAIQSEHGEILRRAMTPNTTGESSKSRSRGKGKEKEKEKEKEREQLTGLGIRRQATSPIEYSYLPDRFDEFGPLPKKPLVFRRPSVQHRPEFSNDLFESSKSTPTIPPKPKAKPQSTPRLTVEQPGTASQSQSPEFSDKNKPVREKMSQLPSSTSTKTPEMQAISRRLAHLREQASSREEPLEIIHAVMKGDIKAVTRLLKSNSNPESNHNIESRHPTKGSTPLILAASLGAFEMLELLLDNNADISAVDYVGRTALHYAASEDFPECTELLLAYGANPGTEDQERETPLHRAVRYLRCDTVDVLLGWSKHPLRQRNGRSQTALHLAARNRGLDIIEKICDRARVIVHIDPEKCASDERECTCPVVYEGVETEDDLGDTALQSALFRRSMDAVSLLLRYTPGGANKPQRVKIWSSTRLEAGEGIAWERPLHYAMRGSSKTLAKRLLDAGADLEGMNSEGKTPFQVALQKRNFAGLSTLCGSCEEVPPPLIAGIVSELTDEEFAEMFQEDELSDFTVTGLGRGFLNQAIAQREWGKLEIILAKNGGGLGKEKIEIALNEGKALEYAIGISGGTNSDYARIDVLKMLFANGAYSGVKIDSGKNKWHYALHVAVKQNDIPLIDLLIRHGSVLSYEDSNGRSPFLTAVIHSNEATISHLFNLIAKHPVQTQRPHLLQEITHKACLLAIRLGFIPTLTLLLPPPPAIPPLSLLSEAICWGRVGVTKFLLGRGCKPEHVEGLKDLEFVDLKLEEGMQRFEGLRVCTKVEGFEACRKLVGVSGERVEQGRGLIEGRENIGGGVIISVDVSG